MDRFDAAPDLPELDEDKVQATAEHLLLTLAGAHWSQLDERDAGRWMDLARYALTVPGVPQ